MTADPKRMAYAPSEWEKGAGEFTDANGTLWYVDDCAYPKSRAEQRRLLEQPGSRGKDKFTGSEMVWLAVGDPVAQERCFSPAGISARSRSYWFKPGDDRSVDLAVLTEQLRRSRVSDGPRRRSYDD